MQSLCSEKKCPWWMLLSALLLGAVLLAVILWSIFVASRVLDFWDNVSDKSITVLVQDAEEDPEPKRAPTPDTSSGARGTPTVFDANQIPGVYTLPERFWEEGMLRAWYWPAESKGGDHS